MHRSGERIIIGRLTEHGRAPYQFVAGRDQSYFIKITSTEGVTVLWGKDLARALRAGATQPRIGDVVGARRVSREPVSLTRRQVDGAGRLTRDILLPAFRTRWEVEQIQHFASRARLARQIRDRHIEAREAVRRHPELKSAFLTLRAAEAVAAKRIPGARDRENFVALVREAMTKSVVRGDLLPDVRIKEDSKSAERTPEAQVIRKNEIIR
jgi:hypothetical protein